MGVDKRPPELRFDWVQLSSDGAWHIIDVKNANIVWCNSVNGIVKHRATGLISNPTAWGNRVCYKCMQVAWDKVYDYTLSRPKKK
jgi:hypothetical protein